MRNSLFILLILSCTVTLAQKKGAPPKLSEEASMKAEMALIDGEKYLILENYAKALEMFRVARELNPKEGAIHFKIAQVLYQNSVMDEAIVSAEKAISLDPTNKFYYLLAADIQTARSDLLSAQKFYEELLKMPGNEDYLIELALLYQYQGKDEKALEAITKAQDHFGTSETLVKEKQKILFRIGQSDKIIAEWERLVKEEPTEESHFFTLADLLISNGQMDKAETYLRDYQTTNGANNRSGLMLAEIMKLKGRLKESMQFARSALLSKDIPFDLKGGILNDFLKAVKAEDAEELKTLMADVANIHPDEHIAQAFAGDVFFQLGDKEQAREYYVRSSKISPDNFSVWQNVLTLESDLAMYDSLIVHSEKAIEFFPNQAALYYFAGTAYLRKKNYNRSVQLLEMGKRYVADNKLLGAFHGQLGDAYNGQKNYTKSDKAYDEALALDANNEHVLNNYSYFLALRKAGLEKAAAMSSKLIQLRPDNATYLDTHGWILYAQGNYKEAKKHLQRASELSTNSTYYEHYGDVLFKLGDVDGAVAQWEKAASQKNASELVQKKIADRKLYE